MTKSDRTAAIAAHLAAYDKKHKLRKAARIATAKRNKKRGLWAFCAAMQKANDGA